MKPIVGIQTQYLDFDATYIARKAQENGWRYDELIESDGTESGLCVNPVSHTKKFHRLEFVVDGLACEYYTAEYIPAVVHNSNINAAIPRPVEHEMRLQVQIFAVTLPYQVEDVYVESRTLPTLSNILRLPGVSFDKSKKVRLEGDFNTFFNVYVPEREEVSAFTILAPNIMTALLRDGADYDFEFSGNKVYFYQTFKYFTGGKFTINQATYDGLLTFGINSARMMARAGRPAQLVDSDNNTPLWQLNGSASARNIIKIVLFMFVGFLVLFCVMIPFLWPLLLPLIVYYAAGRRRLKSKRKKLID